MKAEPEHWDPTKGEEEWWRDMQTSDRGYRIRRNGQDMIRLDRPNEEIIRPLTDRWTIDRDLRPLTRHNIAQVAFLADRKLAFFLGDHSDRRAWDELHEDERIKFMEDGPEDIRLRNLMFAAIMKICEPVTK